MRMSCTRSAPRSSRKWQRSAEVSRRYAVIRSFDHRSFAVVRALAHELGDDVFAAARVPLPCAPQPLGERLSVRDDADDELVRCIAFAPLQPRAGADPTFPG